MTEAMDLVNKVDEEIEKQTLHESEEEDSNDYKFENDQEMKESKRISLYSTDDDQLETNFMGSIYGNNNSRKRLKKQMDMLKRMRNSHRRKLLKESGELLIYKKWGKRKKKSNEIQRKATLGTIETHLVEIEQFRHQLDFIDKLKFQLEEICYEKAERKIDEDYHKIVANLIVNLKELKQFKCITRFIVTKELEIEKLFIEHQKFIEKWEILEKTSSEFIQNDVKQIQENPKVESLESKEKAKLLKKQEEALDKLKNDSLSQLQKWLKAWNIDAQGLEKSKKIHEEKLAKQKAELKRLGISSTHQDFSDEELTNSKKPSINEELKEKPKIHLKDSAVKQCIESMHEAKSKK
jgi:hypothetical protein